MLAPILPRPIMPILMSAPLGLRCPLRRYAALSVSDCSSSSNDLAKECTPSSSSVCSTSGMSIPASRSRSSAAAASSASASTVRFSVPWSSKACRVPSGMVLTLAGPMRLST